jgi:hypothetical protein
VEEIDRPTYTLICTEGNELYILIKQDCIITKDELLFHVHGKFCMGQSAEHLKKTTTSWIGWDFTPDTLVMPDCKGVKTKNIPQKAQTMQVFLQQLEHVGVVRVTLQQYKSPLARTVVDGKSVFELTGEGESAMSVAVEKINTRSATLTLENFYTSVSMDLLKKSPVVNLLHRLSVNESSSSIQANYPGVFLKNTLRVTTGQLILLSARADEA